MEKTVFLFQRNQARDPDNFAHHYVTNHAVLGRTLTRTLKGYTVNIVKGGDGPDAVTEHWVDRATDLLDPEISYATPEDFQKVLEDDRSMFSSFVLHVVVGEKEVVSAPPLDARLGDRTPEAKAIWFYPDAAAVPPPPAGARRVIDSNVGYRLNYENGGWARIPSDIAVMRSVWAADPAQLGDTSGALIVDEYREIAAPALAEKASA